MNNRWFQLALGIVAMVMIANLQYGWTLFVSPLQTAHGWSKTSIQFAFTLFVLFQVWLVPATGYLVDRFGPRPFDPIETWERWLVEVHEMPASSLKDDAIEEATRVISEMKLYLAARRLGVPWVH